MLATPASIVSNKKTVFGFFLLFLLALLPYFIAYFPACMSPDSEAEWNQAIGIWPFDDGHPVVYTQLIRVLSYVWKSPAVLIVFNLLLFAGIYAKVFAYFRTKGMSLLLLLPVGLLFAFSPTIGRFMVTFWKDVTYTLGICYLTYLTIVIVQNKGQTLGRSFYMSLYAASVLILIARHNGMLLIPGYALITLYLFRKNYVKPMLLTYALALATFFLLKAYIHSIQDVKKSWYTLEHPMARHLGSYWVAGKLTDEEKKQLTQIIPDSTWEGEYSKWTNDGYAFGKNGLMYRENVPKHKTLVRSLFFKKLWQDPMVFIRSELNITQFIWAIVRSEGGYLNTYCNTCGPGKAPALRQKLDAFTKATEAFQPPFYSYLYLWSAAPLFWLYVITALVFVVRKQYLYTLIFAPVALNIVSLLIASPAQDLRYIYDVILIFPLILFFVLHYLKRKTA